MALIDPGQAKLLQPKKRRNKYGNTKIVVDDERFDSIAEACRYIMLLKDPDVRQFKIKPVVNFSCGVKYIPDFQVWRYSWDSFNPRKYKYYEYEDVKGVETPAFKIKKKLMEHNGDVVRIVRIESHVADAVVKGYLARARC